MVTRRVKTGGRYVTDPGGGPAQWQNTYEDREYTGSYVTDPGGGPAQWQYTYDTSSYAGHNTVVFHQDYLTRSASLGITTPSGFFFAAKLNVAALPAAGSWGLFNVGRNSAGAAAGVRVAVSDTGGLDLAFRDTGANAPVLVATAPGVVVAGVDTVVHVSADATQAAQDSEQVIPPAGYIATFTIPYVSGSSIVIASAAEAVEGVDFTVTQASPAILDFTIRGVPFTGVADDATIYNPAETLKVWVNGEQVPFVMSIETLTDSVFDFTSGTTANNNRSCIGVLHNSPATPTYTAASVLGYQDGGAGDVQVLVDFILFDDVANPDPSTTSNNGADIDLSAFASDGATPALVLLGGSPDYTAADWNAGINRGTGGNYTMSGDVTA